MTEVFSLDELANLITSIRPLTESSQHINHLNVY